MSKAERVRPIVLVNFSRYNPPPKLISKDQRAGSPLNWVRLSCDWIDDADLLDSEDAMRLWPRLLAVAGRQQPHGVIRMTKSQLGRRVHLDDAVVNRALTHLWKRGLIRYSLDGAKVATKAEPGGSKVAPATKEVVRATTRTHVPTRPTERTPDDSQKLADTTRLGRALDVIVANAKANVLPEAQELVS